MHIQSRSIMLIDEIEKNNFHKNENFKNPWLTWIFIDIINLHKYKTSKSIQNISFLLPMLLPNPCGNTSREKAFPGSEKNVQ